MRTEHADEDGRNEDGNIDGRLGSWKQTEEKERGEESEPFQRDGLLSSVLCSLG